MPVAVAPGGRRHSFMAGANDEPYTADEVEFIMAMDRFKREHRKPFPDAKACIKLADSQQQWASEPRYKLSPDSGAEFMRKLLRLRNALGRARAGKGCAECGGTGIMEGDPNAPMQSILAVAVPCPECSDQ